MAVEFSHEYIQKVANIVRTKLTNASQSEIEDLAQACIFRLKHTGVKNLDPNDALIRQAIYFYAKGYYGLNPDDRCKEDFEKLAIDLSCDSNYNSGEEYFGV